MEMKTLVLDLIYEKLNSAWKIEKLERNVRVGAGVVDFLFTRNGRKYAYILLDGTNRHIDFVELGLLDLSLRDKNIKGIFGISKTDVATVGRDVIDWLVNNINSRECDYIEMYAKTAIEIDDIVDIGGVYQEISPCGVWRLKDINDIKNFENVCNEKSGIENKTLGDGITWNKNNGKKNREFPYWDEGILYMGTMKKDKLYCVGYLTPEDFLNEKMTIPKWRLVKAYADKIK